MKIWTSGVAVLLGMLLMIGPGNKEAVASPRGKAAVGAVAGFAIGAIFLNEMMRAQAAQAQAAQAQADAQARAKARAQARAARPQAAPTTTGAVRTSPSYASGVVPAADTSPSKPSRLCGAASCQ